MAEEGIELNNRRLKVSILVHNINRAAHLERCLDSVASQSYRPLEVVILDAGSTDDSLSVISRWTGSMEARGIEVRSSTCPLLGVAASRNLAAGKATGDLLFVIDNDATFASADCIDRTVACFLSNPALAVVSVRILQEDTNEIDPFTWVYRRSEKNWSRRSFMTFTFTGGGFCVRASAFREAGGFWDHLKYSREEEELGLVLVNNGWEIQYVPEVAVRHYPDPRGRSSNVQRRYIELRNGILVMWRRLPLPVAVAGTLARICSMTLRIILKEKSFPRDVFRAVCEARNEWRESGLQSAPVSMGALLRYCSLHIPSMSGKER